jgi:uncharacterized membrane protein YeaQ/YmgE (transglycosylase-associated protein family)
MKLWGIAKYRRQAGLSFASVGLILLTGCRGAPSINLLGSFFPAWMLCIALGLIGALILHQLFRKIGIDSHLGPRPVIYFCLWLLITLGSWLLFFRS